MASRASSTKTRIETRNRSPEAADRGKHQEQVPRKQGLKHLLVPASESKGHASRASSTKTRIETQQGRNLETWNHTSRASSTKTRIETGTYHKHHATRNHQEQVPRKQGLKPREQLRHGDWTITIKSKFHENKD